MNEVVHYGIVDVPSFGIFDRHGVCHVKSLDFAASKSFRILSHQILQFLLAIGKVIDSLDDLTFTCAKAASGESHSPRAFIFGQSIVVSCLPALVCRRDSPASGLEISESAIA